MTTSGRGVWNKKTLVNEARSIDILDLQRKKVFNGDSTLDWVSFCSRNGEVVAIIFYQLESGENGLSWLRFMYAIANNKTGEKKNYNYIIPVVSTPCNYGGKRWWFICPLIVNSRPCQRRCRIVYMPLGAEYFGCRECHQLTYESRQRHREKFYEGFEKPYKAIKVAQKELVKARTWEMKEKIWQKLSRDYAKIERYKNILIQRTPKIIYKEK